LVVFSGSRLEKFRRKTIFILWQQQAIYRRGMAINYNSDISRLQLFFL
jgi:hypothetical protein